MLFKWSSRYCFGGHTLKRSHAKTARPLNSKAALHVVLSSGYAKGKRSLLRNEKMIQGLARALGKKHGVKIFRIVCKNQDLHLLLRFHKRRSYMSFIRALSGLIPRKLLGAERGTARRYDTAFTKGEFDALDGIVIKKGERFWKQRPFTRILPWGPQFTKTLDSLVSPREAAQIPALGFFPDRWVNTLNSKRLYYLTLVSIQKTWSTG